MKKPTLESLRAEYDRQNTLIDAICSSLEREGTTDVPQELFDAVMAVAPARKHALPLLTIGLRA